MIFEKGKTKLATFQDLYELSKSRRGESFDKISDYLRQYKGTREIYNANGMRAADADVVRNITYELIESQISVDIPAPKVDPAKYTQRHDRNAKSIERLLSRVRNELPFERMNDQDERTTYIKGGSVWFVEWDDTMRTQKTVGGVRVSLVDPDDFFPQPGIYEVQDMDWIILRFQSTVQEIAEKYGVTVKKAEDTENDAEKERGVDDEIRTVLVALYKTQDGNISQYVWSGNVELCDNEDYYCRKRYVCDKCGKRRELSDDDKKCECGGRFKEENDEYELISRDITLSDGYKISATSPEYGENGEPVMTTVTKPLFNEDGTPVMTDVDGISIQMTSEVREPRMAQTKIRWYVPRHFPVIIRKNISHENSVLGQSDCEFISGLQVEVNKLETRIHEKIMSGGKYPFKPQDLDFEFDNTIGEKVLNLPQGTSPASVGVIDTTVTVGVEQSQSDRLYDQAKRLLGISDSFQGQYDPSAKSGVAKQAQIAQAAGRLQSKRVMKNAAYADIDKAIFEMYLAYADEPREVSFTDEFGQMQGAEFNRYDFVEYDDVKHEWYVNDEYLFSVDLNGGVEQQRETMWQLNLNNLQSGVFGDPADMRTLLRYWQMQEKAHYPHARENVDYFTAMIQRQAMGGTNNG